MDKKSSQPVSVYIKKGKVIGKGGFSVVYEAEIYSLDDKEEINLEKLTPETNKMVRGAIKYISLSSSNIKSSFGIESLMELYIMKYIKHQTINSIIKSSITPTGQISLIQYLAFSDLSHRIRKEGHKLWGDNLRECLWQIACGIAHLHRNGILHGDIKAGNILCFEFGDQINYKVNDFSLSRFIPNYKKGTRNEYRHTTYTSTHRPIEVWKDLSYSFSADIWALGCTFYEVAFGVVLFLSQSSEENLKAFEIWNAICQDTKKMVDERDIKSPQLSPAFVKAEDPLLNDLLFGMLNINLHDRYTIWDILSHEYFSTISDDMKKLAPSVFNRHFSLFESIPSNDILIREANTFLVDSDVASLGIEIFERSRNTSSPLPQVSLRTCVIVANKLLYRSCDFIAKNPNFLSEEILLAERLNNKFLSYLND
jgi:serine/threonine protein kinase